MSKIENIKNHVRENKKAYLVGASSLAVGAAVGVGYALGARTTPKDVETLISPSNNINGLSYKPTQKIEVFVEALGDPGNIIQDMTTGTIYASQGEAARALGVSRSAIHRHLYSGTALSNDHILVKLGKAMVGDN